MKLDLLNHAHKHSLELIKKYGSESLSEFDNEGRTSAIKLIQFGLSNECTIANHCKILHTMSTPDKWPYFKFNRISLSRVFLL